MASGKYMEVLRNEKSMNDAILSVLANLHKAAWKKSNHIWSPCVYESLKNIWGEGTQPRTNKIGSEANKKEEPAKANMTILKDNDLSIQANAVTVRESDCEIGTEELSVQVDCKFSDEKLSEACQNMDNSLHGDGFETCPQNHGGFITPFDQNSLEARSGLIINGQNQLQLSNNNIFRRPMQYGAPDKLSFSKQKSLQKEANVASYKEYDVTGRREIGNGLVHQNALARTETSCPSGDSTSSDDEITSKLLPISKSRCAKKTSKQLKTTFEGKDTLLRSKRNRDDSDSSTGSNKPLQKKISARTGDVDRSDEDKEGGFLKTLLSVKIMREDHFYEITVNASEFDRIRKKYPQLGEVLPDIDTFEKEVPYCAEAVKIIIGYLFRSPFDFSAMPDGRVSVEIIAATKAWDIQRLHDNFLRRFLEKVGQSNCRTIHSLAKHFNLHQVCNACKTFLPDCDSSSDRRPCKSRKCFIAVSRYIEPLELCIPLGTAEQLLNDNFDRDIRNIVTFEAITRDFNVGGFQITLDVSDDTTNDSSAEFDIFYSIKSTGSSTDSEEIKLSRPFRPNIVVHFKRKVVVKKGEKMQISVETTIKPYLCFETYENFIKTSNDAEFSLTIESTYRVKNSGGKRFIIGKLLYNPVDEVQ